MSTIFSYKYFLFLLTLSIALTLHAQKEIDSLRNLLPQTKGEQRVDVLNSLSSFLQTINLNESKQLTDESLALSESIGYEKGNIKVLLVLSSYHSKKSQFNKADSILRIVLPIARRTNDIEIISSTLLTLGSVNGRNGKYPEALEYNFEGLSLSKEISNNDLIVSHLINIGIIKQQIGEFDNAKKYWSEAIVLAEKNGFVFRLGQIYLSLGVLEYQKNNLGLSIKYNKKAYETLRTTKDILVASRALNNLGFAYNLIGNTDEAIKYYNKSLELRRRSGDSLGVARILLNKAKILKKEEKNIESVRLVNESIEITKKTNNLPLLREGYEFLFKHYEESKEYKAALDFYRRYRIVRDSIESRANKLKVKEITSKYEFSELEKENELIQLELKSRNQLITIIVLSFLLGLFILFLNRHRINKKLKRSRRDLEVLQEESILQSKEWEIEKEQLSIKLEKLLKQNSNENQLSNFSNLDLTKVVENIKNKIVKNKDWLTFTFYFEIIHPHFFKDLKNQIKIDFTVNEQRLISLIKIRLTTKEIANILSISPGSVLKAKSRLKTKFDLDSIKDMDNYIRSI